MQLNLSLSMHTIMGILIVVIGLIHIYDGWKSASPKLVNGTGEHPVDSLVMQSNRDNIKITIGSLFVIYGALSIYIK